MAGHRLDGILLVQGQSTHRSEEWPLDVFREVIKHFQSLVGQCEVRPTLLLVCCQLPHLTLPLLLFERQKSQTMLHTVSRQLQAPRAAL